MILPPSDTTKGTEKSNSGPTLSCFWGSLQFRGIGSSTVDTVPARVRNSNKEKAREAMREHAGTEAREAMM